MDDIDENNLIAIYFSRLPFDSISNLEKNFDLLVSQVIEYFTFIDIYINFPSNHSSKFSLNNSIKFNSKKLSEKLDSISSSIKEEVDDSKITGLSKEDIECDAIANSDNMFFIIIHSPEIPDIESINETLLLMTKNLSLDITAIVPSIELEQEYIEGKIAEGNLEEII